MQINGIFYKSYSSILDKKIRLIYYPISVTVVFISVMFYHTGLKSFFYGKSTHKAGCVTSLDRNNDPLVEVSVRLLKILLIVFKFLYFKLKPQDLTLRASLHQTKQISITRIVCCIFMPLE